MPLSVVVVVSRKMLRRAERRILFPRSRFAVVARIRGACVYLIELKYMSKVTLRIYAGETYVT